jgi:hypothetical protein
MSQISKKDRLIIALRDGQSFTAKQLVNRFKFASVNSATGVITHLRNEGYNIVSSPGRGGITKYSLVNSYTY